MVGVGMEVSRNRMHKGGEKKKRSRCKPLIGYSVDTAGIQMQRENCIREFSNLADKGRSWTLPDLHIVLQ